MSMPTTGQLTILILAVVLIVFVLGVSAWFERYGQRDPDDY